MKCKICQSETKKFSTAKILEKYDVDYFQCQVCRFVQTEEPYWLGEAYAKPINKSDFGYVARNVISAKLTLRVIANLLDLEEDFLDYGSGYGLLVRLMRDVGLKFYAHDKFCENIFSSHFDVPELLPDKKYELITAFEVFEHLPDPLDVIDKIVSCSRNILFSTVLLPPNTPKPNEWAYYIPHEGQHISLFTSQSLQQLAKRFNLNCYSNGNSVHLLTDKILPANYLDALGFIEYDNSKTFEELQSTFLKDLKIDSSFRESQKLSSGFRAQTSDHSLKDRDFKIVIDGVFFQLYKTGIARVWRSLLEEWSNTEFGQYLVILDRNNTAPKVPGLQYRTIAPYRYETANEDRLMVQAICEEEEASLFLSTYYTTPLSTPSVFMAYDMIPEVMGWDLHHPMWQEKHRAIQQASAYLAISQNTANDLAQIFSDADLEHITVAHCGASREFVAASPEKIAAFKAKYGIVKPYFMLVGAGGGPESYKNAILFFQAFSKMPSQIGFEVICTGQSPIDDIFRECAHGTQVHSLRLSDEELIIAYSGAVALVYPSKYEGFGLPLVEAMSCGCPVITCPNASMPEVAGDAALYVNDDDVMGMADALCDVQKPKLRQSLIAAGLERVKQFTWKKMAETVQTSLIRATLETLSLQDINYLIFPDWTQPEEQIGEELQIILGALSCHLDKGRMTLIIDNSCITEEDAGLLLSGVAMNLMLEEGLDLETGPDVALTGSLNELQWKVLLQSVHGRIVMESENIVKVREVEGDRLKTMNLSHFSQSLE